MELQLTIWDRMTISGLVGGLRGDAALMHKCIKVFDAVDMTDEEKEKVGLRQAGNSLTWNDSGRKWEISIKDKEAAALVLWVVKENQAWSAASARHIAGLHEALGLDWPPKDDEAVGQD